MFGHRPSSSSFSSRSRGDARLAVKRLSRDLRELSLMEESLQSVSAVPEEHDIRKWHVNLRAESGPYEGIILHLTLQFPVNYPNSPPDVVLLTNISHPNVFGSSICLDMLKRYTTETPYQGWSTAYSAVSILLQLQSFLFAENIPQDYGANQKQTAQSYSIDRAKREASETSCSCGHGVNNKIYPPLGEAAADGETTIFLDPQTSRARRQLRRLQLNDIWRELSTDMLIPIFECLEVPDLYRTAQVDQRWERIIDDFSLVERIELHCFHTKHTFKEDMLGVGVTVERHPDGGLKTLSSELDILSYSAFDTQSIRTSVWGQHFDFFLPLAINKQHFENALPILRNSVERISMKEFNASTVLDVICSLMNSFVVSLFLQNKGLKTLDRHASEKALLGYCSFHHLLLSLAEKYPEIRETANKRVGLFKDDERSRHKQGTRDLGKFLIYLTLTKPGLGWKDISISFVKESLSRNVYWFLKKHPFLADLPTPASGISIKRLQTTLQATQTSRKLIMFQIHFLNHIGRRAGQNPTSVLKDYNQSLGKPSKHQKESLQQTAKAILTSDSWDDYFRRINVQRPTQKFLTTLLVDAVKNSETKGYHKPPGRFPGQNRGRGSRRGGYRGGRGGYGNNGGTRSQGGGYNSRDGRSGSRGGYGSGGQRYDSRGQPQGSSYRRPQPRNNNNNSTGGGGGGGNGNRNNRFQFDWQSS